MKKIKAASLIAASVIAVSSFGTLTAGAVTFTEDETTGAKTWAFTVNDSYPDGVSGGDSSDATFANGATYYANNGWTTDQPADENAIDYLTLSVKNNATIESVQNAALHLMGNNSAGRTASELTWAVPEDGTVSVAGVNGVHLYVNNEFIATAGSDGNAPTVTHTVEKDDQIKVTAANWGGITEFTFTPVQTRTAMYSFTETADNLNGKTLYVDSTAGQKTKELTGTYFTGKGDVRLGVIINNIPRNVTINSVTIQ